MSLCPITRCGNRVFHKIDQWVGGSAIEVSYEELDMVEMVCWPRFSHVLVGSSSVSCLCGAYGTASLPTSAEEERHFGRFLDVS